MVTINEIFYSVQGESSYAGRPCVFVRLTACDLRCSWCDTPYAFHEGTKRPVDDVLAEVDRFDCPLVEVTGGEPLLQEDVYPLIDGAARRAASRCCSRPAATAAPSACPAEVVTILDVKCPGSGEAHRMDWANLDRLRPHDEVKFVIKDRADYDFARDVTAPLRPGGPGGGRPLLAGPRRDGPAPALGVGAPGPPPRARPGAAAQVHLGPGHAWRLTPSSS